MTATVPSFRDATAWRFVGQAEAAGWKSGQAHRALFLDRDGVINVNHGYVHRPEDTDWVPGIFELCQAARAAGFVLVVVTNQAGIGRGYYTEAQFREYTGWVHRQFASRGVPILATYYCPEHPEAKLIGYRRDSFFRKPQPGMLLAAARDWGIDLAASLMVGDKPSDIEAAQRAEVGHAFLVETSDFAEVRAWIKQKGGCATADVLRTEAGRPAPAGS